MSCITISLYLQNNILAYIEMKKLTLLSLTAALTAAFFFSSCKDNNGKDDLVTGQVFKDVTCAIESLDNSGEVEFTDLSFGLFYNYDDITSISQIAGLKLADGSKLPVVAFNDLPWTLKDGWKITRATDMTPIAEGAGLVPEFKTFEFDLKDFYSATGVYAPGFFFDFVIGSTTHVYGPVYKGTTITTSEAGATFTNEETSYFIKLNQSASTAAIKIFNARFIDGMPKLNLAFDAVPYEVDGGKFIFNAGNLIPSFGGAPFPRFPISGLKGELDFFNGFSLEFTCTYSGSPYKVVVNTKWNR